MHIYELNALEMGRAIAERRISAPEALEAVLTRAEQTGQLNALRLNMTDAARAHAQAVQARIDAGEALPLLAGVPIAIKDCICTRGTPTTCGSRMLANFTPPYDATVITRLRETGMVPFAKANMDEFALGTTTETSHWGVARNPWQTEHVPGGSSGGSAAAVAAQAAPCALGTDTGGSIRQPSAFCGVTGLKPTYGTVSRYGLIAAASSMDQIGPIARDAADCAALLDVLAGHDRLDSTSVPTQGGYSAKLGQSIRGLRIGLPRSFFTGSLDEPVRERVLAAAKELEALGAIVEECDLDMVEAAVPVYYILNSAELSSNLARYDGVQYGYRAPDVEDIEQLYLRSRSQAFGMEVKRRTMLGCFVLSSGYYEAYYRKASRVRTLIRRAYEDALRTYDMILGPTTPNTAPRLGDTLGDALRMYQGDIYTASANLTGLPALTLPCGHDPSGLPVGMQLTGRAFDEATLLQAAYRYQQATAYHRARPAL